MALVGVRGIGVGVLALCVFVQCSSSEESGSATNNNASNNNSTPDSGEVADGASAQEDRITERIASSIARPDTPCPTGYVACDGTGYCCPDDGQCSTSGDGTCVVAPSVCDSCADFGTGPLCCNGLCCPEGTTCNGTFCQAQAVVSPRECTTLVDVECSDGCCPRGSTCDGDVCRVRGGFLQECPGPRCEDGTCCGEGTFCCGSGCCAEGSTCTDQGTCLQAADTPEMHEPAECPAQMDPHVYDDGMERAACCPTGLTTPPNAGICAAPNPALAPCGSGEVEITGYCCPDLSALDALWNGNYYIADANGDATNDCIWSSAQLPTCSNGSPSDSGLCCPNELGTAYPVAAGQVCCPSTHAACGNGCCQGFALCALDDPEVGGGPSCELAVDAVVQSECPDEAPIACGSLCCPTNTACEGSYCGCPLNAAYWCGDSCAPSADDCGSTCPMSYPTACGEVCCAGSCFDAQTSDCGCGEEQTPCISDDTNGSSAEPGPNVSTDTSAEFCCDQADTCTTVGGELSCAHCADDTRVCGAECCAADEDCVDGRCEQGCATGETPCGDDCCGADETCQDDTCVSDEPNPPGDGDGDTGGECPETEGCTCSSSGDCCTNHSDCSGILDPCVCPTQ